MQNTHADLALDQIVVSQTNKLFRDEADFTPAALNELAESIKKTGVYSPILVRPNPDKEKSKSIPYELIFGERRLQASRVAGVATIPAIIREMNDEEALEAQVVENLQRENVNPMKEARAFQWMEKTKKMSSKQIADRIGKSVDYIQERVRLNSLITKGQELVASGDLPLKAALKLTRVPEKMQKDCIDTCFTELDTASGKRMHFNGNDVLQEWLDDNIYNELARADFSTEDATLNSSIEINQTKQTMKTLDNSIIQSINTDDDVFAANNTTREQFEEKCKSLELDEYEIGFRFLTLLCRALNAEWRPDFDNNDEWKYEPWFLGGSSGFRFYGCVSRSSNSDVGSRFCFDTREKAIHAGKNFTSWYKGPKR